jgi:isoquinoline 1-oxidoreductase beta subunit
VHVVQGGGSFGRRLFFDSALEAARISKAMKRPVKLMWSRVDDMRHGRARAASHHKLRATVALGNVLTFEHRVASVETDFRHGLGEILTAMAASLPVAGNLGFAQTVFLTTIKSPYNFGITTQLLNEVPLRMHTGSWRSVYSANTRGAEEIFVDEIARKLGRDPVAFRRAFLKTARQRAVLDKVVTEGGWGKALPAGFAQGVGFHDEYKSCTACLVTIDARDTTKPRVVSAVIAADYGRPINPRGLESQLLGGLSDAISTTLRAGLHIDRGLPLEGSYSQFHYARQKDTPTDVKIFIMPATGEPGGAGELGVPAAVGAIANAYARATGVKPRSFPIIFPVDFEPFPR